MRLHTRTWGDGPRLIALIHGFSDDGSTWWRLGPDLASHGYTVIAPDLRGHGESPRAQRYLLSDLAADLVATLPRSLDFVLGHSLGALALGLAAPSLDAATYVFVDPPWTRSLMELALPAWAPASSETVLALHPGWSAEDVICDVDSNALLDPAVPRGLADSVRLGESIPIPTLRAAAASGSNVASIVDTASEGVVMVPANDAALPLTAQAAVGALGYRLVTVPHSGHVIHRDNYSGFLNHLHDDVLNELDARIAT